MKKYLLSFVLLVFVSVIPCSGGGGSETADIKDTIDEAETCLLADPTALDPDKFFDCEEKIIRSASGSGGFFLESKESEWIRRGRSSHSSKGVPLSKDDAVHSVIANSLYNAGKFKEALKEYELAQDHFGIQRTTWMILNPTVSEKGGIVIPVTAKGDPRTDATEICSIAYGNKQYSGIFKVGIYLYDPSENQNTLIYLPSFEYNWPIDMILEGPVLITTLRDNTIVKYDATKDYITLEPADNGQ